VELNLSLMSSGLIRLLLGRMAGLAEINNAWSMAQGAWSDWRPLGGTYPWLPPDPLDTRDLVEVGVVTKNG